MKQSKLCIMQFQRGRHSKEAPVEADVFFSFHLCATEIIVWWRFNFTVYECLFQPSSHETTTAFELDFQAHSGLLDLAHE